MSTKPSNFKHPEWWNAGGFKIVAGKLDQDYLYLVLESRSTMVVITKASCVIPNKEGWLLDWRIEQKKEEEKINLKGRNLLNNTELEHAFAIPMNGTEEEVVGIIKNEKFIRQQNFLNFLCSDEKTKEGIGISIYLYSSIKSNIKKLLKSSGIE